MNSILANNLVNGALLIYHHPIFKDANTINEYIRAFEEHSCFKTWKINTEYGFPKKIITYPFRIIILHYSLFGVYPFKLDDEFINYLKSCPSYKIAFFQDEYQFCKERFSLINDLNLDCVYTLVEPDYFNRTYQKYTNVPKIISCIPGYVSDQLPDISQKHFIADEERKIDIGYRGRRLPAYMGKDALEKTEIAERFVSFSKKESLNLDIATDESSRLYGDHWYEFLANCKGVIGVESGVSIFDLDGNVFAEYQRLLHEKGTVTYEDLNDAIPLDRYENDIPYRTISPRHFEAAAFRICQILFEGHYSGILKPMIHYIPLKKDFSNFTEVMSLFRDSSFRKKITDQTYSDLITSGEYTYKSFIKNFDTFLIQEGFSPDSLTLPVKEINSMLNYDYYRRLLLRSPVYGYHALLGFTMPFKAKYPRYYQYFEKFFGAVKKIVRRVRT